MIPFTEMLFNYVCPTLGSLLASVMFAAPVADLRTCLIEIVSDGQQLNTRPWTWGLSNCLGWTLYGFMKKDPFVTAANVPGLILYVWMNSAAARLEYFEMTKDQVRKRQERWEADADNPMLDSASGDEEFSASDELFADTTEHKMVMVPQEQSLLQLLVVWVLVMVYCTWFTRHNPTEIVGMVVNLNLIVFYGAPLQTIRQVIATSNSQSIHGPSMVMTITNTTFWTLYGLTQRDLYIIVPNVMGLSLGILQALLKLFYPTHRGESLLQSDALRDENPQNIAPEEELPPTRPLD